MPKKHDDIDLEVWGGFIEQMIKKSESDALILEIDQINARILTVLKEQGRLIKEYQEESTKYGITPNAAALKEAFEESQLEYAELNEARKALVQEWAALGHLYPGIPPQNTRGNTTR